MKPIRLRSWMRLLSFYIIPITLLCLSIAFANRELFLEFGEIAFILLGIIVFITPLTILIRIRTLQTIRSYRRELGITTFWFFFFHAAGMIYIFGFGIQDLLGIDNFLFWGAVAGIGMSILALTSNNYSVRILGKHWKTLHRIVYIVFFTALWHTAAAEGEPIKFYLLGGIFILLKGTTWYWKRKLDNE